jgi:PRTRC genetic system protein E
MAITNFFSQVAALNFTGCLNLTMRRDGESLTVSVLLQNDACGDTAKNHIPPLLLKGTAQELGEGFFPAIAEPVQQTSQLLTNMEQFLKGQEEAKKNSAMEKKKTEKADKPATEVSPKEKKFIEAMKVVDDLEAEGKFKEAWCKVPLAAEYPDKAEQLRKRKESLKNQFAPDLFGASQSAETQVAKEENTELNTEDYADSEPNAEDIPDEGEGE